MAEPRFKLFTGALKAFKSESGRRTIHCTASSAVDDLHGDIIIEDCVRDMAAQAKSKQMTIFLNHEYTVPEDVFGKTMDATVVMRTDENGALVADMDLDVDVNEVNPRAIETHDSILGPNGDDGVTLGVSIGAIIEDYAFRNEKAKFAGGLEIKKVNLLEASIVGIPANPRSWVQNGVLAIAKSLGEDEDEIKARWNPLGMLAAAITTVEPEEEEVPAEEKEPDNVADDDTEPQPVEESAEEAPVIVLSHNELPDKAFACIESGGKKDESGKTTPRSLRHYPHHTAGGELDKPLLRSALSRIADKNNIQCGKGHLMSHAREAGIGEKTEDGLELKIGDEIWVLRDFDPEYDHEPEESEPFSGTCNCSDPEEAASLDLDLAPEGEAQVPVEETAQADLDATEIAADIAKEISPALRETFSLLVKKLEEGLAEIETLKTENEELKSQVAKSKDDFEIAAEIVDSLSRLPLARKTSARRQVNSFYAKFSGIYPEGWLKLIEERNKETKDEPLP